MYQSKISPQAHPKGQKVHLYRVNQQLTFAQVFDLWEQEVAFRTFYNTLLANSPYDAFHWETPPFNQNTCDQGYEFILLEGPGLTDVLDPIPFQDYFRNPQTGKGVVVFPNLGHDAILVVPSPAGPSKAYPHLAAFVRHASETQVHALWKTIGETVKHHLSHRWTWLNTAGGGVAWLHVRLDSHPKYYRHRPYRKLPV
jgi:hypothetical protein